LFAKIVDEVPWHAERRQMYARVVDVPRLLSFYDEDEPLPHPVLDAARTALSRQYDEDLREPFRTAGLCYYQTGGTAWRDTATGSGAERPTPTRNPECAPTPSAPD
jgi:hypothetical protein